MRSLLSGKGSENQCAGKRSFRKPWLSRVFVFYQVLYTLLACALLVVILSRFCVDSTFIAALTASKSGRITDEKKHETAERSSYLFGRWLTRKWRASGISLGPLPLSCSGDILAISTLARIGSRLIALPCSLFPMCWELVRLLL